MKLGRIHVRSRQSQKLPNKAKPSAPMTNISGSIIAGSFRFLRATPAVGRSCPDQVLLFASAVTGFVRTFSFWRIGMPSVTGSSPQNHQRQLPCECHALDLTHRMKTQKEV